MVETMTPDGHPIPFLRSYWVAFPHLLAGNNPGDWDPGRARERLVALLNSGVRAVINLTEQKEMGHNGLGLVPYDELLLEVAAERGLPVHMDRLSIPDMGVPTSGHMTAILDALDTAIDADVPVYLHC
jgi:polymorphic toxin system DSP-PTPase phosphatase-like protein